MPVNSPRVGFVSLGCPKALVDSERILTQLRIRGYEISPSYEAADLVVVNTCGFIDSAIDESLEAIGEALDANGKVVVTGCLGGEPRNASSKSTPRCSPSPAPMPPSRCSRQCTNTCRARTIPSPTWCPRRASASRRAIMPI